MQEQYQISDNQMAALKKKRIGTPQLFRAMPLFNHCGGLLGLMYYADTHGNIKKALPQAIFNSLPAKQQLQMFEYLDWLDDGEGDYSADEVDLKEELIDDEPPEQRGWMKWMKK